MSGGPLLKKDGNDVVGIATSCTSHYSSRPNETNTFVDAMNKLLTALAARMQEITSETIGEPTTLTPASIAASSLTNYQGWRYYSDRKGYFSRLQVMPDDPAVTNDQLFDRVDLIRPFTRPLREFLLPGRRVNIEVTVEVYSNMLIGAAETTIRVDRKRESLKFGGLVEAQAELLRPELYKSSIRWRRDLVSAADLEVPAQPPITVGATEQYGHLFNEPLLAAYGVCTWDELTINFEERVLAKHGNKISNVTGSVAVSFTYDQEHTYKFEVTPHFFKEPKKMGHVWAVSDSNRVVKWRLSLTFSSE